MNESADNQSGLRRSSRKRISTTVRIQGYEVKALNNYDVTASSYVMGTYQDDPQIKKKPKTATIANSAAASSNKAPRKPSRAESNRTKHNENVRKSIETKQSARIDFLAKHRDVLDPFMDEHTRESLQKWSEQKKPHIPYQKEELYIQPDLIEGGEMRDYQLAGLNFLVDLHRQNIGQILGDEMGKFKETFCSVSTEFKKMDICAYPTFHSSTLNLFLFRPWKDAANYFIASSFERKRQ